MNNWNIDDFGRDVRSTIQDAINTGDFSRLSRNINNTVNRAFGGPASAMAPDFKLSKDTPPNFGAGTSHMGKNGTFTDVKLKPVQFVYKPVKSKSIFSILAMCFGYGIAGILAFSSVITGVATPLVGTANMQVAIVAQLVTAVPFLGVGVFGTYIQKKCKRFTKYMEIIKGRDVCNISELVENTGYSEKAIVKDLNKLIDSGWLCQAHMDNSQKSLMLTHKAYEEYKTIMAQRKEQERKQEAQNARHNHLNPEVRQLIMQGEEYIATIRRVNDEVPGEEVSNKMYKMEDLVRRIFKRVEEKPEQAGDLKRLMNYYLPTSIKLLEAYGEMDKQENPGENIINSKKEIEDTLDTLNVAYEKFLDDMFRETAWDVSSDVSVLKTMLAREGLTKNDFEK